ncbi:MAG TPA: hypothetical protein VK131_10530 [Candidatus Acidoferrales bacterium]|nr:hypothetical protein [Candidatus Acidoferrales bacterium]
MPWYEDSGPAGSHPTGMRCPRCGMVATKAKLADGTAGWQCTEEPCSHLFQATQLGRSWSQLMEFLVERNRHESIADRSRYWQ